MRPAFQSGFYDAVMSYRIDRDPRSFVSILSTAVSGSTALTR